MTKHVDKLSKNLVKLLDRYEEKLVKQDTSKARSIEQWNERLAKDPKGEKFLTKWVEEYQEQRVSLAQTVILVKALRFEVTERSKPKKTRRHTMDGVVTIKPGETVEIG